MGQACRTIQIKISNDVDIDINECVNFDSTKFLLIKSNHKNKLKTLTNFNNIKLVKKSIIDIVNLVSLVANQ